VAHFPADLHDPSSCQWGRREGVQELLRHSSSRITMDIYAQAQMPAKRAAQQKVVEMVPVGETRTGGQKDGLTAPQGKRGIFGKSFVLLASPTGFEPVLSP
jgi:hypothetical protein